MVVTLTEENFEEEVLQADVPVLVDFWATWCGPCQMQGPIVEALADKVEGAKICKLDVDGAQALAIRYKVMNIPTILVFRNGEVDKRAVGVQDEDTLMDMLGV